MPTENEKFQRAQAYSTAANSWAEVAQKSAASAQTLMETYRVARSHQTAEGLVDLWGALSAAVAASTAASKQVAAAIEKVKQD